ncbi:MAG TPA: metabolite traffic protein EboE, partial [Thermomicrobiales bacterium]|nr:metabolite traffic protein EboE [Thermomicrobiales bacterium]
WQFFTQRMVQMAERLVRVREADGKLIHLDLEPEPDGLLGDCAELITFYEEWLIPLGVPLLSQRLGVSIEDAREKLLEHIRVCFDTCHVGVGFESPREVLARFDELGIKVGKIQISSALKLTLDGDAGGRASQADALRPFDEPVYLHQVIQKNRDGSLTRYLDLPDALPLIGDEDAVEWRIHFHVPIFIERFTAFESTQSTIIETFDVLKERPFTDHLEIETYTWDVLPEGMKEDIQASIAREYEWVLNELG